MMCGIAGFFGDTRESILQDMLKRIRHRGPDDMGSFLRRDFGMGNVRLSIVDLLKGKQPMWSNDKTCCVVYNGELYGYQNIRKEYLSTGYHFQSNADTEILLPLYQKLGLNLFEKLNGMFAFCLYDDMRDIGIIARDHLGIKPIVYTTLNQKLYFASEIKAFYAIPEWRPKPDRNAWHAFLNIRFPPAPLTLFNGVKKVPPGCYLLLQKQTAPVEIPPGHECMQTFEVGDWLTRLFRYYTVPQKTFSISFQEAVENLGRILNDSFQDQMIADVDVGIYLSGGIDSSTITAYASKQGSTRINSICLGFNEPTDENNEARLVAQRFKTHHQDLFLSDNPLDYFREAVYFMEEPKVNCLQGYLLAREARKYQKVMLSGLGGDELFGGYDIYEIALYIDRLINRPSSRLIEICGSLLKAGLGRFPSLYVDNCRRGADICKKIRHPLDIYLLLRNQWDHDEKLRRCIYSHDVVGHEASPLREHFIDSFPHTNSLTQAFMQFEFSHKMVDDFLSNEDRTSMAHGLEVRVPFLDRRVVEFVYSLPLEWKIRFVKRKYILKQLVKDILPQKVLNKKKHGFTFNPVLQFQKDLGRYAQQYLSSQRIHESGVFNYRYIQMILSTKPNNTLRWHYFLLWKILGYHIWEDVFIKQSNLSL